MNTCEVCGQSLAGNKRSVQWHKTREVTIHLATLCDQCYGNVVGTLSELCGQPEPKS